VDDWISETASIGGGSPSRCGSAIASSLIDAFGILVAEAIDRHSVPVAELCNAFDAVKSTVTRW
jgi:hypothetical protein